jgi:hypothetical protein
MSVVHMSNPAVGIRHTPVQLLQYNTDKSSTPCIVRIYGTYVKYVKK